jgi:hypothetical protein
MANPQKGEVSFEAGGASYTMRLSVDALCALEEATGKGVVALSAELSDPARLRMSTVRHVVWAGLREHHPDVSLKAAGELIVEAGGLAKMMEHVSLAFQRAFPDEEKKGKGARPQKPDQKSGTGPASTPTGAA